uniref:Sodium/potassium/calcium exchanger 1 n=1 Tax=Monopterus albus TaxID=43700 RepID=A0A3Q3J422_MONAL
MYCTRRKRLQLSRILFLLSCVFLCTLYQLTISARLYEPLPVPQIGEEFEESSTEWVDEATVETQGLEEPLTSTELDPTYQTTPELHVLHHLDPTSNSKASTFTESPPFPATNWTIVHCIYVAPEPPEETHTPAPSPPVTTITSASPGEVRRIQGEYPEDIFSVEDRRRGWVILHIIGMMYMFVSLAIVCDEFFVPALGVITDKLAISDDVAGATFMAAGGSAPELFTSLIGVFIILHLTWWPLFRDVSFYILDLSLLIIFFLDNVIIWWESMMLVASYTLYVIFMKFNVQLEWAFKTQLLKHNNIIKIIAVEEFEKLKPPLQRGGSSASLHNSTMRNTIFQLMIHTLDPLAEGEYHFTIMTSPIIDTRRCHSHRNREEGAARGQEGTLQPYSDSDEDSTESSEDEDDDEEEEEEEKKEDEPLSLEWPDTRRKQATYLFLLPIVFPLWLTVPDVRNQKYRKFFVATFLGSILWIAVFSYLMVWWAHQVGETIGISEEIMGLTILAAGTSIPDLITSVIVARKGLGDMAVSSSVGSNIFDITVGLPLPWLLYSFIHGLAPVAVSSNGLFCAIVLLFLMLLFVIISIAYCRWKMNKMLGFTMFLLYFIFLVLSVMLEDRIIVCPVSI